MTRPNLAMLALAIATPSLAAEPLPLDKRVDRVEKELKAVQRKVFPGGSPAFFEPEIAPAQPQAAGGTPATQPLNEIGSRVDAVERELARLTGQVEQIDHRLTILSEQSARDRQEADTRLKAVEGSGAPATAPLPAPGRSTAADSPFRAPAGRGATAKPASVAEEIAAPPTTGDPAEAAYMAGYRLWADKKFADAEDALGKAAAQYPKHRRASYARNLQGRAFLDDGQPAEAARILYGNYQKDPRGERAPESLFYLGDALTRLKKYDDACKAYGELNAVYGVKMGETIRTRLPAARKAARCESDAAADGPPATTIRPAPKASTGSAKTKK